MKSWMFLFERRRQNTVFRAIFGVKVRTSFAETGRA